MIGNILVNNYNIKLGNKGEKKSTVKLSNNMSVVLFLRSNCSTAIGLGQCHISDFR